MDALTYIIAFMVAIIFGWIGYFLGNFFPVFGRAKKIKDAKKAAGQGMVDFKPLSNSTKKMMDWLLEREQREESEGLSNDEKVDEPADLDPGSQPMRETTPSQQPRVEYVFDHPEGVGDDATILWHDRRKKKLVARLDKEMIDLDEELNQEHHGNLSMLLVDLQEKVGLSATLREAIAEETDKVFSKKQRKKVVPKEEEELKGPSFNPIRTFVNYVQSDAPKLDDSPESIPDQINEILQEMIKDTPLATKGISVADWPNRGVVFIVGVEVYEDIHRIPDSEIRLAIRSAVKKWEQTQAEE